MVANAFNSAVDSKLRGYLLESKQRPLADYKALLLDIVFRNNDYV
jgi:hypothetical protein